MAFTAQQKREHRAKPEVRERERQYKHDWDVNNRARKAEYQRRYRSGKPDGGSTTTPTPPTTTTNQRDLFDADSS